MAFPAIGNTNTTNGTAASASAVVNLPTGIVSGNLLLVLHRSAVGTTAHSVNGGGYTNLFNDISDASDDRISLWYRQANGTEGATITITQDSSKFASLSWRITGHENPATQAPQFATLATGTSLNPNPGPLTPTGGAKDYLWLAIGGWEGEQTSPPGTFPANYTLNQIGANSGTAGVVATNCRTAGAGRQLNAVTEDPGTYTISASDDWTATTVAIHPASSITNFQTLPASSPGISTLVKVLTKLKTLPGIEIGIATLAKAKLFIKSLPGVEIGIATLSRILTKVKTLPGVEIGIATLSRILTKVKTLSVIELSILTIVKKVSKTLSVIESSLRTLNKKMFKTFSVIESSIIILTKAKLFVKTLATIEIGIVTLSKALVFARTLASTEISILNLVKTLTLKRTLAVIELSVLSLVKVLTLSKILSIVSVSIPSFAKKLSITIVSTVVSSVRIIFDCLSSIIFESFKNLRSGKRQGDK